MMQENSEVKGRKKIVRQKKNGKHVIRHTVSNIVNEKKRYHMRERERESVCVCVCV